MAAKRAMMKKETGLPERVMEDVYADAGMGAEHATSDDMTVPFIKLAQALSDEVNKRESAYIDGLEQGDFFNSATQDKWGGDKGFAFIPCHYERQYLEWTPRDAGGGFQGSHGPEIMEQVTQNGPASTLPNGNEIVQTGAWFGLVVDENGSFEQAVISLSKVQMKKSRQLMTMLKSVMLSGPNGKFNPPTFYNVVRFTSVPESNDQGSWYGWKPVVEGNVFELDPSGDLYAQAKVLGAAVKSGKVKQAVPEAKTATTTDDGEIPF